MFCVSQNASAGVSRMLLGNKCDIEAKRKVSKEIGEKVSAVIHTASMWVQVHTRCFIGVRSSFPVSCFLKHVNASLHACKISFFFSLKHKFFYLKKDSLFFIIARKGTWYSILRD